MGKASSSKKVARAAGLGGGRAYASRPPYAYYFGLVLLVVLGVVGVYNATQYRDNKVNEQGNVAPTVGQIPSVVRGLRRRRLRQDAPPDPNDQGPLRHHDQDNGVISVSPTVKAAAGNNATLGKFASSSA